MLKISIFVLSLVTIQQSILCVEATIDRDQQIINNLKNANLTDIEPVRHIEGADFEADGTINRDMHKELFNAEHEMLDGMDPEQIVLQFRTIFRKIDLDKNKLLDKIEMGKWMHRQMNIYYENAKIKTEKMFEYMDIDKNDKLFWDEYKAIYEKLYKYHVRTHTGHSEFWPLESEIANMRERWQQYDRDQDNALDSIEFFLFRYPETDNRSFDSVVHGLMIVLDVNADSKISLDEYVYLYDANSDDVNDRLMYRKEKRKFESLDTNKDNILDIEELKGSVYSHTSWVLNDADDIFEFVDGDGDNLIDIEEMLYNIRYFVDNYPIIRQIVRDEL